MPRLEFAPGLPEGWAYSKLADICELISRGRSPQYVDHSPVRAIGQRCVRDSFDGSAARGQNLNRLEGHLKAVPGDVLLNSTGTGTIGRSCVFNDAGNFVVDSHVTVIRPQAKKLHPQWVNMLLRSPQGQTNLETFCYAGSTNQVELARTPLAETEIPLPPLLEQRRIAAILNTLDCTIEGTQRVIEKLQATRQGYINELADSFQNQKRATLRTMTKAGSVTMGRGQIISHPTMAAYPGDYPVYSSSALGNGEMGRYGRYMFDEELITWSVDGGGRFFYRPKHRFSITNVSGFMRLRASSFNIHFAFLLLDYQHSRMQFDYTLKAHPSVIAELYYLPVAVPVKEQAAISAHVALFDRRIDTEWARLSKLQVLKRGLMDDLLTGRVRVPVTDARVGA